MKRREMRRDDRGDEEGAEGKGGEMGSGEGGIRETNRGARKEDCGDRRRMKGEIERKIEVKEREKRRKNLIVREIEEVKKGKRKEMIEEIFKDIG